MRADGVHVCVFVCVLVVAHIVAHRSEVDDTRPALLLRICWFRAEIGQPFHCKFNTIIFQFRLPFHHHVHVRILLAPRVDARHDRLHLKRRVAQGARERDHSAAGP